MKTKHHHLLRLCSLIFVIVHSSFGILHSQTPNLISYQGRVAVGTPPVNFEGTGNFRFALVSANGNNVYWSNSPDIAPANGVPDAAVNLTVTKGLYSVLLGDTSINNMDAIPVSAWNHAEVRLRVWFNDGVNGSQQLTPDQRLAPAGYFAEGSVDSPAIATGAITTAKIANNAVTAAHIAADAVTAAQIATGAVTGPRIADGAVSSIKLNDGAVTNAKLASNAVTADKIANGAVTTPQITDLAVTKAKIADGAVDTVQIANQAVGAAQIAGDAVTSPKIADGSVNSAKLANNAVQTGNIANGAVTVAKLGSDVGAWTAIGGNVTRPSGWVGIGVADPASALDVAGIGNFSGGLTTGSITTATDFIVSTQPEYWGFSHTDGVRTLSTFVGAAGCYIGSYSNDPLHFFTASNPSMTVATSGNVGIGITNPVQALHVAGQGVFASTSVASDPGGGLGPAVVIGYNSTYDYGYVQALHSSVAPKNLILQPDAGAGNVGIGPGTPATTLDVKGDITCTAINLTSDRNAKEAFKPINAREVLSKVARLPISEWQYKGHGQKPSDGTRHIGPMAQDFQAAFALGHDEKHITSVDADGVALAAIQGLNEKVQEQDRDKDARIKELEKSVAELKRIVEQLAEKQIGGGK